jgi:uncharacterized protein YjbJ (UPF0337 family)
VRVEKKSQERRTSMSWWDRLLGRGKDTAEDVSDTAGDMTREASSRAEDVGQEAQDKMSEGADKVEDTAQDARDKLP